MCARSSITECIGSWKRFARIGTNTLEREMGLERTSLCSLRENGLVMYGTNRGGFVARNEGQIKSNRIESKLLLFEKSAVEDECMCIRCTSFRTIFLHETSKMKFYLEFSLLERKI